MHMTTDPDEKKERGQSIILVAVFFVALILFVAIAVDMSDAYFKRRTAQNAADAAAFAGGRELARQRNYYGRHFDNQSRSSLLKTEMNNFAEQNNIDDTNGVPADETNANVEGYYLDRAGDRLPSPPNPIGSGPHIPATAYGIEAVTHIEAPTFFGGIFGLSGLPLTADAAVSVGVPPCGVTCVVPIATLWDPGYRDFTRSTDPDEWIQWSPDYPPPFTCYNIWNGEGSGNFGWLNWRIQGSTCHTQDCDEQCLEYNLTPGNCIGYLAVGEWVAGTTGTVNSSGVQAQLNAYIDGHISFAVPLYAETNGETGCNAEYLVAGFARMQLIGYQLPQGDHYDPWVPQEYLSLCTDIGDPGSDPDAGTRLTAYFLDYIDESSLPGDCDAYGSVTTIRLIK
jgi:hypothetical protein